MEASVAVTTTVAIQLAKTLSDKRKKTAEQFTKKVKHELQFLNMPGIEFQVELRTARNDDNGIYLPGYRNRND